MTRELLRAPRDYTSREKKRVLAVVIKPVNLRDGYPEFGELTWPAKHTDLNLDHRKFPEREIRKRKGRVIWRLLYSGQRARLRHLCQKFAWKELITPS